MSLLSVVAPVFALIAMGAAARRLRLMDAAGLKGLYDLVFYVALPSLLFTSVVGAPELRLFGVASAYFVGCLAIFAAAVVLSRRVLGARLSQAAMVGLNASFGNTVMMGVPLISAAFGAAGVAILLPIIAIHSAVLLPIACVLIAADGRSGVRQTLAASAASVARNPIIVAIALAFVWRGLGIPLIEPLRRLMALLSAGAPALALICLGASLPPFDRAALREAAICSALKLAALPALVWAIAALAGTGPLETSVAVLTAGTPTGANAFLLARRMDTLAEASAGAVVLSTALSIFSLSALLTSLR